MILWSLHVRLCPCSRRNPWPWLAGAVLQSLDCNRSMKVETDTEHVPQQDLEYILLAQDCKLTKAENWKWQSTLHDWLARNITQHISMLCTCDVLAMTRWNSSSLRPHATGLLQDAEAERSVLMTTMRAWRAALRPRYTSVFKPTGLCWLPPAMLPHHVADGVPLQKRDYARMVQQVGQRCVLSTQACPCDVPV